MPRALASGREPAQACSRGQVKNSGPSWCRSGRTFFRKTVADASGSEKRSVSDGPAVADASSSEKRSLAPALARNEARRVRSLRSGRLALDHGDAARGGDDAGQPEAMSGEEPSVLRL